MEKHKRTNSSQEGFGLRFKRRSFLLLSGNCGNHVVVKDVCCVFKEDVPLLWGFFELSIFPYCSSGGICLNISV